jgi:hypothetical protein
MGRGKSNAARVVMAGTALDPLAELWRFVFANNGDLDARHARLARYHRGVNDATAAALGLFAIVVSAAIAYAQSAPGVTTSRDDTAQNAATLPPAMNNLLLRPAQPRSLSPPGRKIHLRERLGEPAPEVLPIFIPQAVLGQDRVVDAADRNPCRAPQDGRLTVTELAKRVGLSISPCRLQRTGGPGDVEVGEALGRELVKEALA